MRRVWERVEKAQIIQKTSRLSVVKATNSARYLVTSCWQASRASDLMEAAHLVQSRMNMWTPMAFVFPYKGTAQVREPFGVAMEVSRLPTSRDPRLMQYTRSGSG